MTETEAVAYCRSRMHQREERRLNRRFAILVVFGLSLIAWASIYGGMAFVLSAVPR